MRFKKIYVEITNRCNLNCSFCSRSNRNKKDMTVSEFEQIIMKIKDYTNYVYLHIKGEPLIHPNLDNLLQVCNKYNINVNITTNGINIDKCRDVLLKNQVRQVNFSLHSYIGSNPDGYLDSIFSYVDFAKKNNKYSVLRFWAFNGVYSKNEEIFINKINNKYNISLKDLLETNNSVKLEDNVYVSKSKEFIWPSLDNSYYNKEGTCYALRDHIGILSDGTVVPCCLDCEAVINLGNIFDSELEEILNSDIVVRMRKGFCNNKKTEELCCHCNFLNI